MLAMQCSVSTAAEFAISAERIAHTRRMASPVTRKMGLDAMEQSGSSKRALLSRSARVARPVHAASLDLPGGWLDLASELMSQGPKGQLPRMRAGPITNARNDALSR